MSEYTEARLWLPASPNGHARRTSDADYERTIALLEARLYQLELQLEEQGWMRLGDLGGREFSRDALDRIIELARVAYLKNPLIKRAVEVGALYVWGQDLSVNAVDPDVRLVIDRFWHENRATLTGQQASRLLEVELEVTGNLFLALFPDRISGIVRVRQVPVEEIRQILTNPEDRAEVWFYERHWAEQPIDGGPLRPMRAYYPDWRYRPASRPAEINGVEVRWETPLLHVKAGAFPHWLWGVPEVYAALDWARAYKELLEDDATRSRALARFAWNLTTRGGAAAIAAARAKLGSTFGTPGGTGIESNPPPTVGSTFIAGEGVTLEPIRIAGATLPTDHSRPAKLMAAAALGLPETFFGDVDVGNLATAKSLDRPTELRFSERRQLWRDVLSDLVQWVIDRDLEATRGILSGRQLSDEDRAVELSWPDLLERSVTERVQAVVDAATLAGRELAGTISQETVSRLLLVALGVEDVDAELERLADEQAERDMTGDERAQFMRALRELREAIRGHGR